MSAEGTADSRARADLDAARLLLDKGYAAQAASRAYYAAFYAAEDALAALGERRARHAGLISAFGRLVVKEGGFDVATGALLRDLFDLRGDADYGAGTVTVAHAEAGLASAARFVGAVERWIANRSR